MPVLFVLMSLGNCSLERVDIEMKSDAFIFRLGQQKVAGRRQRASHAAYG